MDFVSSVLVRLVIAAILIAPASAIAADAKGDAPHNSFMVKPGFRLDLVATEPLVTAPVAVAFDENGRCFVAEMPDATDPASRPGRVRVLDKLDETGAYQDSGVYAEGLKSPSALACYDGGVFVATAPDLIFLKDTKGDGVADVKRVVLTGFGTNHLGLRFLPHSFNWGLDNRIHGGLAGVAGTISIPGSPASQVPLYGSDFSFFPDTLAVLPEAGSAQSGLTFGSAGDKFACGPDHPLWSPTYAWRYASRNTFAPQLASRSVVLSPATLIYRWAPTPRASPPTNSLAPGWLSSVGGCVVYRGDAFPSNYLGNVFVADSQVVHRAIVRENGLEWTAERAPDEARSEFLVCKDASFRPVQLLNGPGGGLYIVDRQDGRSKGRIYHVVPDQATPPKPVPLRIAKTYDLVALLARSDGWTRDTVARLLFERRDPESIPLLTNLVLRCPKPLGRIQALRTLDGIGALTEDNLLPALRDKDPRVREHALQLSEGLVRDGAVSDSLWKALSSLVRDPSPRVRHQLALTLGDIRRPDKPLILARLLALDPANPKVQTAVLTCAADTGGRLFRLLAGDPAFRNSQPGPEFLRRLALMVGTQGHLDQVGEVVGFFARTTIDRQQTFTLLHGLGEGLQRTQSSLALVDPNITLQPYYTLAYEVAVDSSSPEPIRVAAVNLLAVSPLKPADLNDWLLALCNPSPLPALQSAAIRALCQYDDPLAVSGLLGKWRNFSPYLRDQAINALLARRRLAPVLLAALESGRISVGDFSSVQLDLLRTCPDPAIGAQALKLLGPVSERRPALLDRFRPALSLPGNASRGRALFQLRCATCHQFGAIRQTTLAPDLIGARARGKVRLLTAILEPGLSKAPDQTACVVETNTGDRVLGIVTDENPTTVGLRRFDRPAPVEIWPRFNAQAVRRQPWSLMPAGLEQGLSVQDMADLLEFLTTGAAQ